MKYMFARRANGSKADILEIKDEGFIFMGTTDCSELEKGYRIKRVIKNNDDKMVYEEFPDGSIRWNIKCGNDYLSSKWPEFLRKNKYDRIMEFDDDESAILYLEVLGNEL